MKIQFIVILLFLKNPASSQTVDSIDSLVKQIDKTYFTDSITLTFKTRRGAEPFQVSAFLKGDSLLKTIARFNNSSRLRTTYYQMLGIQYSNALCVKDIDSTTNKVLVEIYGKDDIGSGTNILKSNITDPLEAYAKEKYYPSQLLSNSNYSIQVGFALVDRKASKYHFKGRLIKAVPVTPGCGIVAWAIVQKFEVISTTFRDYNKKFVLIIQTCPVKGYFKTGQVYDIDVATNSGVTFNYAVVNDYKKENLPVFWTRAITKSN